MRKTLGLFLKPSDYFLHADMFNVKKFSTKAKVYNTGLGESNLLNIAGGLASEGNNVYIYSVAGFIIHRYEQLKFSCRDFGSKHGKIIICNAGKYGYENFGNGHKLDDDLDIMDVLNIPYFIPENKDEFKEILLKLEQENTGIWYIQLGKDNV